MAGNDKVVDRAVERDLLLCWLIQALCFHTFNNSYNFLKSRKRKFFAKKVPLLIESVKYRIFSWFEKYKSMSTTIFDFSQSGHHFDLCPPVPLKFIYATFISHSWILVARVNSTSFFTPNHLSAVNSFYRRFLPFRKLDMSPLWAAIAPPGVAYKIMGDRFFLKELVFDLNSSNIGPTASMRGHSLVLFTIWPRSLILYAPCKKDFSTFLFAIYFSL